MTLDGVMEDPGGAEKFVHGGWSMAYWHDEIGKVKFDELFASDALLLRQHDLVDDYWLLVYPVVLGSGKRLFRDGDRTNLKLVESRSFPSGVVLLHYQPANR